MQIIFYFEKSVIFAQTSDDVMIESTDTTIRKRSLAEEMAVRLQEQIAQGRFEVGGKLPTESELMKISGSAVRRCAKP